MNVTRLTEPYYSEHGAPNYLGSRTDERDIPKSFQAIDSVNLGGSKEAVLLPSPEPNFILSRLPAEILTKTLEDLKSEDLVSAVSSNGRFYVILPPSKKAEVIFHAAYKINSLHDLRTALKEIEGIQPHHLQEKPLWAVAYRMHAIDEKDRDVAVQLVRGAIKKFPEEAMPDKLKQWVKLVDGLADYYNMSNKPRTYDTFDYYCPEEGPVGDEVRLGGNVQALAKKHKIKNQLYPGGIPEMERIALMEGPQGAEIARNLRDGMSFAITNGAEKWGIHSYTDSAIVERVRPRIEYVTVRQSQS